MNMKMQRKKNHTNRWVSSSGWGTWFFSSCKWYYVTDSVCTLWNVRFWMLLSKNIFFFFCQKLISIVIKCPSIIRKIQMHEQQLHCLTFDVKKNSIIICKYFKSKTVITSQNFKVMLKFDIAKCHVTDYSILLNKQLSVSIFFYIEFFYFCTNFSFLFSLNRKFLQNIFTEYYQILEKALISRN